MRNSKTFKTTAFVLCFCFSLSSSGCTRLRPDQYETYGYKGEAEVKQGRRIVILDWLGNIFGALPKLILWNWRVNRHNIQPETRKAIDDYLSKHPEVGNLQIQLNRYAPQDAWRRLVKNKGVQWPYRLFLGTFVVLIADTLLINRLFGFDYYNPFTHSINLFSDLPSVALHELGHAEDFSGRRYRGSYALMGILPFTDLYHEYQATDEAFHYVREQKDIPKEIEAYKVLYPAYGTYVGGYMGIGFFVPVIVGHIWGRTSAADLEKKTQSQTV